MEDRGVKDLHDFRATTFPLVTLFTGFFFLAFSIFFSIRDRSFRLKDIPSALKAVPQLFCLFLWIIMMIFCIPSIFNAMMYEYAQCYFICIVGLYAILSVDTPYVALYIGLGIYNIWTLLGQNFVFAFSGTSTLSLIRQNCMDFYAKEVDQDTRCSSSMLEFVRVGGMVIIFFQMIICYFLFVFLVRKWRNGEENYSPVSYTSASVDDRSERDGMAGGGAHGYQSYSQ